MILNGHTFAIFSNRILSHVLQIREWKFLRGTYLCFAFFYSIMVISVGSVAADQNTTEEIHATIRNGDRVVLPDEEGYIGVWRVTPSKTATITNRIPSQAYMDFPGILAISDHRNYIDLTDYFGEKKNASVSAWITISAREDWSGWFLMGSDDGFSMSIDGSEIYSDTTAHPAMSDQFAVDVSIARGEHVLCLEITNGSGAWGFFFRVVNGDFACPDNLAFSLPASLFRDQSWQTQALQKCNISPSLHVDQQNGHITLDYRSGGFRVQGLTLPPIVAQLTVNGTIVRQVPLDRSVEIPLPDTRDGAYVIDIFSQDQQRIMRKEWLIDPDEIELLHQLNDRLSRYPDEPEPLEIPDPVDPSELRTRIAVASIRSDTERLMRVITENEPDAAYRNRIVHSARIDLALLQQGKPEDVFQKENPVTLAYRSPFDHRLQRFVLYQPRQCNSSSSPFPLIVALHGQGTRSRLTIDRVFGCDVESPELESVAEKRDIPLPDVPWFVLASDAHGDAAYRYYSEWDVLRTQWIVEQLFPIDRNRVFITGLSLGGYGAASLALKYPDRYAGCYSVCGYYDLMHLRELRKGPYEPWETWCLQQAAPQEWVRNARNLAMFCDHGTGDEPERARVFIDRLHSFGYSVKSRFYDMGHEVWRRAYRSGRIFEELKNIRRNPNPKSIRFSSCSIRNNQAYWIRIEAFLTPRKQMVIQGDVEKNTIQIHTQNIKQFSIRSSALPSGFSGTRIRIDGQPVSFSRSLPESTYTLVSGQWEPERNPGESGGSSRHRLEGPLHDIWNGPVLFVIPGRDQAWQAVAYRVASMQASGRQGVPGGVVDIAFPVKTDREVTDEDRAYYSLALFGNAQTNMEIARLGQTPIQCGPSSISISDREYSGLDTAAVFIQPSPYVPDRYIRITLACTPLGLIESLFLPQFLPDYVIFNRHVTTQYGGRLKGERSYLEAGHFGDNWNALPGLVIR